MFIWLILSILVGWFASTKGRSGFGMFFVALLLSPLLGGIIALILEDKSGKSNGNTTVVYVNGGRRRNSFETLEDD